MKKQILVSSLISLAILGGNFATIAIKNADAKTTATNNSTLAFTDTSATALPTLDFKNETVYLITDRSGTVNKKYVGNLENTSAEPLPINLDITYYLDGVATPASELIGKSGHVRIIYSYTATKTYQDKFVPFVTVTALTLDSAKFTNLTTKNAKIISENGQIVIAGYALVGLGENLGTDLLPSSFELEADVTDFGLSDSYTIAVNDLIADLDTTKLTSIDSIISSINSLSAGLDQILAGANRLNQGAAKLADGLNQVVTLHNQILAKANEAVTTITTIANEIIEEYDLDPELVTKLTAPVKKYYDEAYTAITSYTNGIKQLADGANELHAGTTELQNGLTAFKYQGIDKLVNFANRDLNGFVMNLRKSVEAASSYRSYATSTAHSTKFIFKTPSIR